MKQKIFMYLFVFLLLLVLFQYVNSKRVFEDLNNRLENYTVANTKYKDSIVNLQDEILNLSYFDIEGNEDALTYFENDGHNVAELIPYIKDELYKLNEVKGEHPLVPYASGDGKKMLINTVKILNHKWIIANFSDGDYWGELFLTYFVNPDKTVEFNLVESFLYPFD
ncbi:hydrolase [Aestuariivivens insulae]|uniref:hydrolase n=1 Tax=Aestuariivivens insulae TaxID=1621988 RepID=UPI001F58D166|nr:hydrolase [Aestuariivivens insulae]